MAIQFKYEITKEISDATLEAIELARKSGKLKKIGPLKIKKLN